MLPPSAQNTSIKISLYCKALTNSGQGVGDAALVNPTHFVTRVVFCFGNKKLCGSSAETPRKLRDGFGSTWPLLLYRSTNSQVTASGLNLE